MERSHIVKAEVTRPARAWQGEIIRNVECIEYVLEKKGQIDASFIDYPLVIVLTQDCDLEQDANLRRRLKESKKDGKIPSQGNLLMSLLVAPLYNAEHVYSGEHLSDLGLAVSTYNKNKGDGERMRKNEVSRYHYLEFPQKIPIPPSFIDFKHFFSINADYLLKIRKKNFVCRVGELFRESISQRFAAYLSRIGLPLINLEGKRES